MYLVDFSTWEPPEEWKVSHAQLIELMRRQQCYTEESLNFMARILENSGTGQATAWPPSIVECMQTGRCLSPAPFYPPQTRALQSVAPLVFTAPSVFFPLCQQPSPPGKPQNRSVENARAESERVICDVIADVLKKTKTNARDVDILIINCSLFSPTPSLCALAAHKFNMRKDILS